MQSKRAYVLIGLLMCSVLIPGIQATEGRDAPQCLSVTESTLSSQVAVANGACMRFDLGTLQPGDVYDLMTHSTFLFSMNQDCSLTS